MSLFVRADNTMLENYVFPMIHPYNCVPSTLKLLQYLNSEDADILSEIAKKDKYRDGGIPMDVVVEILKQITGNESINIACGPTFSIDEPEYKSFEYTFDNTEEPITKIGKSPIKWISKLDKYSFKVINGEDTPEEYVDNLILSIELDGKTIEIYDDLMNIRIKWYDLLSFFKDIVDFRGKTIKVNFASDSGMPIKLKMKHALEIYDKIPAGCLAIGKVEIDTGYTTLGALRVKSAPAEHVIILGKSINSNPYMIDPQTSDRYREGNFARGEDEIFEYIKSMNICKVCMVYSSTGGCKQINISSIEEGQQPVENFLSRQGSLFNTQSSDDSFEINRLDLEDVQRRLETLESSNPVAYERISTGKIKMYLDSLEAAAAPAAAPAAAAPTQAPEITMTETISDSDSSGGYSRSSPKLKTNLRKNNKYKKTCKKKTRKKKTRKKKTRKKKTRKRKRLKMRKY